MKRFYARVVIISSVIQEKNEELMLDSKYDKMTLIEAPLVAGTFWNQDVVDKKGTSTKISAFIQKVEVGKDGKKQYTVRYDDINSDYYEERVIKEGIGVIRFEKLMELEGDSFPVTYFLFDNTQGIERQVKLYFPDKNADKLYLEERNVRVVNEGVAKAAVEALIAGPKEGYIASIPKDTKLLNIYIKNKIAYVDFSKEFVSNHSGGSAGELMTLYSIVNTLTSFDTVDSVQILVEGKKGATLGNILLDRPLERRNDLIK